MSGLSEDYNYEKAIDNLEDQIIEKLGHSDWRARMRLKCEVYLKNNGTKTTSFQEVEDFLIDEALKTFPQELREEIMTEVERIIGDWMSLGATQ